MKQIKSHLYKIPKPIRLFLGKALLFFILWEVIYGLFLFDSQWLDTKLTNHVGTASVYVLNNFTSMSGFTAVPEVWDSVYAGEAIANSASVIYHNGETLLYIAHACNGLSLLVLYIGFIVCMPSRFWRKVLYITLGVLLLDIINIIRCVGLIYLMEYNNTYFDFAHHYLFKATVYISTFIIWVYYSRKIHFKNDALQVG